MNALPRSKTTKRIVVVVAAVTGLGLVGWLAVLSPAPGSGPAGGDPPRSSIRVATYKQLDEIRRQRKAQLTGYLERIQRAAAAVRHDQQLRECFRLRLRLEQMPAGVSTERARDALARLSRTISEHYLHRYRDFYDILFVGPDGTVFHEIRGQGFQGCNLLTGDLRNTPLARRLPGGKAQAFVDFAYLGITGEPSAFFVEPVTEGDGRFLGWFILQCNINRINDIFARNDGLGRTGEVFLVNRDRQMLTDSRFRRDSSILNLHLSPANIEAKFAEKCGHKIVRDYRGCRALSSFEVCGIMGSQWLLIAKIDRAEVVTRRFLQRRQELRDQLLDALGQAVPACCEPLALPPDRRVVDMDEFRRADHCTGPSLVTYGVDTCTAAVICLPGRFVYLGHISPHDSLYGQGSQDLLGRMIERIETYEICPFQLRRLQVVLVAPHRRTLLPAVDKLLDAGLFLSQIRFVHNPKAESATVWHDTKSCRTRVRWSMPAGRGPDRFQDAGDTASLEPIVLEMLDY